MKAAWVMALCACAEAPSRELVVVAHQDDDMLFMQPHLFERTRDRLPTTIVYVTAGDGGAGIARAEARARAVRFAYGIVAGSQDWQCAGPRCSLGELELVFLGVPDGGVVGEAPQSLLKLWDGTLDRVTTIDGSISYTRDELVGAVAHIVDETRPSTIHTLEIAGTHGDDHSDHMFVGALVALASARSTSAAPLVAHRGYNVNYEPPNLDEATFADASLPMRAYLACMSTCGTCGETPCETIDDARYVNFLHRSYAIETRTEASGQLGSIDVSLDERGLLHVDGGCLAVQGSDVVTSDCTHDPAHHFRLDDEGHLWSGLPPAPAPDMQYDHESCVVSENSRLHVARCGASRDARWQLE